MSDGSFAVQSAFVLHAAAQTHWDAAPGPPQMHTDPGAQLIWSQVVQALGQNWPLFLGMQCPHSGGPQQS
jgi:hypothetical protein